MSNAERQREFRERNPGYYARIQARYRAASKAARLAAQKEYAAKMEAVAAQSAAAMVIKPVQLALPAPAEVPVIPGMNQIEAVPAQAMPEYVPLQRRTGPFDELKAALEARKNALR